MKFVRFADLGHKVIGEASWTWLTDRYIDYSNIKGFIGIDDLYLSALTAMFREILLDTGVTTSFMKANKQVTPAAQEFLNQMLSEGYRTQEAVCAFMAKFIYSDFYKSLVKYNLRKIFETSSTEFVNNFVGCFKDNCEIGEFNEFAQEQDMYDNRKDVLATVLLRGIFPVLFESKWHKLRTEKPYEAGEAKFLRDINIVKKHGHYWYVSNVTENLKPVKPAKVIDHPTVFSAEPISLYSNNVVLALLAIKMVSPSAYRTIQYNLDNYTFNLQSNSYNESRSIIDVINSNIFSITYGFAADGCALKVLTDKAECI